MWNLRIIWLWRFKSCRICRRAATLSETSKTIHPLQQRQIPQDLDIHQHCFKNLKYGAFDYALLSVHNIHNYIPILFWNTMNNEPKLRGVSNLDRFCFLLRFVLISKSSQN